MRTLNPQVRTEATEWLLRFSEAEVDETAGEEFSHWLRTSPEHVRAYLRVSAFWQEAGLMGNGKNGTRDIEALVSRAKRETNVFPLALGPQSVAELIAGPTRSIPDDRPAPTVCVTPAQRRSQPWHSRALAAALLLMAGVTGLYLYLQRGLYQTAIGEQRTVNLPDGSILTLDADSRARVRYSERERSIDLEEGQALFNVARDPMRPFVVHSGQASVRAVGTQFDVYRKASGTTVTVVEGKVAIVPAIRTLSRQLDAQNPIQDAARNKQSGVNSEVLLSAGEQLTFQPTQFVQSAVAAAPGTSEVRRVKTEHTTAWTEGLLVFDGAPLSEVVREFNRRNSKPLVLASGGDLADLRISGTFPAAGAKRLIHFLQQRFGVTVNESDEAITLSSR